jgi:hypothetical protein
MSRELLRRRAVTDGDLEEPPAVHDRDGLAVCDGGVRPLHAARPRPADDDRTSGAAGERRRVDVGHEVPEAVDVDDLAADPPRLDGGNRRREAYHLRDLRAERGGRGPDGQRGGDRREYVPSVERRASGLEEESLVGEMDDAAGRVGGRGEREDAVVRADEERARRLDADRPARAPDPGVDDRDVNRPRREVRRRVPERERAGEHVLRRDAVRHVDDPGHGRAARDHALHDADERVDEAEVGRERDDRHRGRPRSASSTAAQRSGNMISWWPVSWMPTPPAAVGRATTFTAGR